jgi:hypothetical protein
MMRVVRDLVSVVLFVALAVPAFAQSSHTGAIVVIVLDSTGAPFKEAAVTIANSDLGTTQELTPNAAGTVSATNLGLQGAYTISVRQPGAASDDKAGALVDDVEGLRLRAGETLLVTVKLAPPEGKAQVTVSGGEDRVRRDAAMGLRITSAQLDETPDLGRRLTTLPLLDSAFRQAMGTGDQFLNATYFVGGAGGRREPSFVVDGGTGNEPRGRQTLLLAVPITAVHEMDVLTNPLSAEYGWTSGPVLNLVTKSGVNAMHGDFLAMFRPGDLQSAAMSGGVCPSAIATCVPQTISGLPLAIRAPDVPDQLFVTSVAMGGALMEDQTFFFASMDFSKGHRTAPITSLVVPAGTTTNGDLEHFVVNARIDHRLSETRQLTGRFNVDRLSDTNPTDIASQDVVQGAGMQFRRRGIGGQVTDRKLRATTVNEIRVSYQQADPVAQFVPNSPSTQFVRSGPVPFTSGESRSVLAWSRHTEFADTLTWTRGLHTIQLGGVGAYATATANDVEFGNNFTYGQFIINPSTIVTANDLTIGDALLYRQGYTLGATSATVSQWFATGFVQDSFRARRNVTLSLGLRYDRQTSVDAAKNFAPRLGFAWSPSRDGRTAVRAGYGMYYSMILAGDLADATLNGPDGMFLYSAAPGQPGFPSSLGHVPVNLDLTSSTLPPRNVTILPGQRSVYASKIPGFGNIADCGAGATTLCYPGALVNPRSQIVSFGIERQAGARLFVSGDYVHQHASNMVQVVDLNAPSFFNRTAPGQVRSAADADLTRPIVPAPGGFRAINVIENGGAADYDGLTAALTFRTATKFWTSASYTLSRATNTYEPDGSGAGPNDQNRLGETERAPGLLNQTHRAVLSATYLLPHDFDFGAVASLASGLPVNATTGVDNNGDEVFTDRPVVGGQVLGRATFTGSPTSDISMFLEKRFKFTGGMFLIRGEGINIFNHANVIGRNSIYGDGAAPLPTFGQAGAGLTSLYPGRTFQITGRLVF